MPVSDQRPIFLIEPLTIAAGQTAFSRALDLRGYDMVSLQWHKGLQNPASGAGSATSIHLYWSNLPAEASQPAETGYPSALGSTPATHPERWVLYAPDDGAAPDPDLVFPTLPSGASPQSGGQDIFDISWPTILVAVTAGDELAEFSLTATRRAI